MKRALVTGANRGIGLELCRQLKAQGYEVIGVCRKTSDDLKAVASTVIEGIDVSDMDCIGALKKALGNPSIDVLINCAGLLESTQWDGLDWDAIERQWQVNTLGPLRVVKAVEHCLGKGSKIVMITSRMGSIADNTSGGSYGYRMSKSALNSASVSLAQDLKPRGIAVGIVHPGYVKTAMTGWTGHIEPQESASGILKRLDELNLDNSGCFWHQNGEVLPW